MFLFINYQKLWGRAFKTQRKNKTCPQDVLTAWYGWGALLKPCFRNSWNKPTL